jgi:hypothetical protein
MAWVKANDNGNGNTYSMGSKGDDGPGSDIDCSGLVSKAVVAGGEKDPNMGNSNGVTNIDNTLPDASPKDVVPGNIVILNDSKHTGVITKVERDENGNIKNMTMVDSGGNPDKGKSGPRESQLFSNGKANYWGQRVDTYKKFDTKPDAVDKPLPVGIRAPTTNDHYTGKPLNPTRII